MKYILLATTALVIGMSSAQAEIICTNRGCYETGMKIFRNGGAGFVGLPYKYHRDDDPARKGKSIRIRRFQW